MLTIMRIFILFIVIIFSSSCFAQDNKDSVLFAKKNFISIDLPTIVQNRISIAYERFFIKNTIGLKLSLINGFNIREKLNTNYYYDDDDKIPTLSRYGLSLDLNYYPTGLKRFSYFLGAGGNFSLFFSQVNYNYEYMDTPYPYSPPYPSPILYQLKSYSMFINNGLLMQPVGHLTLSCLLGIGVKKVETTYNRWDFSQAAHFSFNIGYKF